MVVQLLCGRGGCMCPSHATHTVRYTRLYPGDLSFRTVISSAMCLTCTALALCLSKQTSSSIDEAIYVTRLVRMSNLVLESLGVIRVNGDL